MEGSNWTHFLTLKFFYLPTFYTCCTEITLLQTSLSVPRRTFGRKYTLIKFVPWIRRLVASSSSQKLGFIPWSGPPGFVEDKGKLGQVSVRVLKFLLSMSSLHLVSRRYTISETETVAFRKFMLTHNFIRKR